MKNNHNIIEIACASDHGDAGHVTCVVGIMYYWPVGSCTEKSIICKSLYCSCTKSLFSEMTLPTGTDWDKILQGDVGSGGMLPCKFLAVCVEQLKNGSKMHFMNFFETILCKVTS